VIATMDIVVEYYVRRTRQACFVFDNDSHLDELRLPEMPPLGHLRVPVGITGPSKEPSEHCNDDYERKDRLHQ